MNLVNNSETVNLTKTIDCFIIVSHTLSSIANELTPSARCRVNGSERVPYSIDLFLALQLLGNTIRLL